MTYSMMQLANRAASIVTSNSLVRKHRCRIGGMSSDGTHRSAHLPHKGSGVHVVPLGVADHRGHRTVRCLERVVPVFATSSPIQLPR